MSHEIMKAMLWTQYLEGMGTEEDFSTAMSHLERQQMEILKREGELMDDMDREQLLWVPRWSMN